MTNDNVAAVRNAYAVAERKDLEGWINLFTPEGVFTDNSVGVTYRGHNLAELVRNYDTAFSNMHRELYQIRSIPMAMSSWCNWPCRAPTMARCSFPLASWLPRVSKWTHRAAMCSN